MFRIQTTDVLAAMVDVCLARGEANKALAVSLYLEVAENANSKDRQTHFLTYLVQRPSNYTRVLVHVSDEYEPPQSIKEWRQTSYHDSCWRSDGLQRPLNELYFEMCKAANPNVAPISLYSEASFHTLAPPRIVAIESVTEDPDYVCTVEYARAA